MLIHRGLREVLGSLAEIGYNAEWQDICASKIGGGFTRDRLFIVTYPIIVNAQRGSKKQILRIPELSRKFGGSFEKFRDRSYLPESRFYRKNDGVLHRVDRLRGLGNAIVPQIAELLFRQIKDLI